MIDFDVETTGLQWPYHRAFLYQFGDDDGNVVAYNPDLPEERKWIQLWFDAAKVEGIIAWNSKFDWHFAVNDGFDVPDESMWHDGMLYAHALNANESVALKNVSVRLLGPDSDDLQKAVKASLTKLAADRKKQAKQDGTEPTLPTYEDVQRDLMVDYAMEDIVLTRKVVNILRPNVERVDDLRKIVAFEREVMGALWHVERRGMPADRDGYYNLRQEVIENWERLEDKAKELAGDPDFNPNSSKQIYNALLKRGADLSYVTGESMDKDNLETVDDELAVAILDYRSENKVLSTYIQPMLERHYVPAMRAWKEPFITAEGRIHTNYRQVGAQTGRMSSADPNIQNQPRDDLRLRYNIVAPEGYKLVAVDLSNIEARLFAVYAATFNNGESRILENICNGIDVYADTAEVMGLRDRPRPGGGVTTARQLGKGYFLSKIYGAGIRSVRKQLRCSQDEARMYNQRYNDAYPEVRRLQNVIEYKLDDVGYVKSGWGRWMRGTGREAYKFTNYLVQGTAADLLKDALLKCHRAGIPIVACVHDELISLSPEDKAEEHRDFMIHAMTDYPKFAKMVPLEAEGDIVDRWSQAKDPDFIPNWKKEMVVA